MSYKPNDASENPFDGYKPLLRANNIADGVIEYDDVIYVNEERISDKQLLKDGDILVCASSGSREVVGKAGLIIGNREVTFGAFCKVVRPNIHVVEPYYLSHYFQSPGYRRTISSLALGANINNIRSEHLDSLSIPLPTLPAQKRIVAMLDSICDLIAKRKEQLAKLNQLVKSRFVEMFGNAKFAEYELVEICHFIDYRGKTPTKSESGIPLITAKNVRKDGFHIEPREYIPEELFETWMTRGYPRAGDVLFTTEAPLGNVCRIPELHERFAVGQRIVTLQPNLEFLNAVYLERALLSDGFQRKLFQKSSGSTVTGIRSKLLERLTIPIPPLSLQREFAAFVAEVDKSEFAVRKRLEKARQLYRAKLQEYFG